jgi:hypothetical protein
MERGKAADYRLDDQGTLWLKDRICVPQNREIQDSILREAHDSRYSIHPGCTKMYKDLKYTHARLRGFELVTSSLACSFLTISPTQHT